MKSLITIILNNINFVITGLNLETKIFKNQIFSFKFKIKRRYFYFNKKNTNLSIKLLFIIV
jgi:hypothetical protein